MLAFQSAVAPRDRRATAILPFVAFVFAALAVMLPILAHSHLPLIDLPNHIARLYIEAAGSGPLDTYYSYNFTFAPNSAVDLIWLALGHPGSPERFSQAIMAAYAMGLVGATMVLSYVVQGRWLVWPSVSAILVFNAPFFWGFQNYVVTTPFAILALALWLATERRGLVWRCAVFIPIALLLYLMHFFAFCFLAIAVFGREIQLLIEAGPKWKATLRRSLVLTVPFVLPILWLVTSVLNGPASPAGSHTEFGELGRRFILLALPLLAANGFDSIAINWTGLAACIALVLSLLTLRRRDGIRLRMAPIMKGPIIALTVAMFLAPTWLNGVALVDLRLPFLVLACLLAATAWQPLGRGATAFLTVVFVSVILARGVAFERFANEFSSDITDLATTLESLPEGSRVLPIRTTAESYDLRLSHAQAYAVFLRNSFVPTLFQGVHDIAVRPQWLASSHPALFAVDEAWMDDDVARRDANMIAFVKDWDQKFNYVLLLDRQETPLKAQDRLEKVTSAGRFTLFRVRAAG